MTTHPAPTALQICRAYLCHFKRPVEQGLTIAGAYGRLMAALPGTAAGFVAGQSNDPSPEADPGSVAGPIFGGLEWEDRRDGGFRHDAGYAAAVVYPIRPAAHAGPRGRTVWGYRIVRGPAIVTDSYPFPTATDAARATARGLGAYLDGK
jgi:hypothetical protein